MKNIRRRFTLWYIKRGYTFDYDFTGIPMYDDGLIRTPAAMPPAVWNCPWWVKPLLIFFSPSVYYREAWGKVIAEGLERGIKEGMKKKGEPSEQD